MRPVAEILAAPREAYDLPLLLDALEVAVALELATLPPYLCGYWSVTDDPDGVSVSIGTVVFEEMLHLGLVCNLTTALGGTPRLDPPLYPGPLPGGLLPGLVVPLRGLTRDHVREVYLRIEHPETGTATVPTPGALYSALARMLQVVEPAFGGGPQRETPIREHVLTPITSLDEALDALTVVKERGEGSATSPDAVHTGDPRDLPHHFRFGEVAHGRRVTLVDGRWAYAGDPVAFPETLPMAPVPAGGWRDPPPDVRASLAAFGTAFGDVLRHLTAAWSPAGTDDDLQLAIVAMFELGGPADTLMRRPIPGGTGHYGPDFVVPGAPYGP